MLTNYSGRHFSRKILQSWPWPILQDYIDLKNTLFLGELVETLFFENDKGIFVPFCHCQRILCIYWLIVQGQFDQMKYNCIASLLICNYCFGYLLKFVKWTLVYWDCFVICPGHNLHEQTTARFNIVKCIDVLGAVSIRKTVLPGMAIPMLKIRRPNGRLIFNMEIAIRR